MAGDTLWATSEEANAVLTRRQESTAALHYRQGGQAMAEVHSRLSTCPHPTGTGRDDVFHEYLTVKVSVAKARTVIYMYTY